MITVLIINIQKDELFKKRNFENDFFINYSTQVSLGEAVKIMKSNTDQLMVFPDEWLIYWQADIDHIPKLFGYYIWIMQVPNLNSKVHQVMKTDPPDFLYLKMHNEEIERYLDSYQELKKDGQERGLYILSTKASNINPLQKSQLNYHNYSLD